MQLTVDLPSDLEAILRQTVPGDLNAYAREALGVQLYRDRKITHGQLRRFLGLSSYEATRSSSAMAEWTNAVRQWALALPNWIAVEAPMKIELLPSLDAGEASAISLARERRADLVLIDERAGAQAVEHFGLAVVGTLGVLIEAGIEGVIDFDKAIARLTGETSFYASARLIAFARHLYQQRRQKR